MRTAVNGAGTLWRNSISVACPATAGDAANVALEGEIEGDDDDDAILKVFTS